MTEVETIIGGVVGTLVVTAIIGICKLISDKRKDRILLKGSLTADAGIDILNAIGCACLILSITCKSKRPAKIKESYIAMVVGPDFIESFAKGFGFPFGQACAPDLPAPTCSVKLIPISKPSNKDGYVLERDDVCKFVLPIQIPFLHMFPKVPSEDVSICIKYMNDDEVVLIKGLEVQQAISTLDTMHGSLPMNLKIPLSVGLKVIKTTPTESCGIIGKTNPNPIEFLGGNEGE